MATPSSAAAETPASPSSARPVKPSKPTRTYDPRKRVEAYDRVTGDKLPYKVPETHLDGRFPNLRETPSSKAGK